MQKVIILLLMLCCFVLAQNPSQGKLLILPFQTQGDIPVSMGETFADLITSHWNTSTFYIVEQATLDKNLQKKLQTEGLSSENLQTLQELGISTVMLGQLAKLGNTYYAGYRIVEISSSRVMTSDSIKSADLDGALEGLHSSLANKAQEIADRQPPTDKQPSLDKPQPPMERPPTDKQPSLDKPQPPMERPPTDKQPSSDKLPVEKQPKQIDLRQQVEEYIANWQQVVAQTRSYTSIIKPMSILSYQLEDAMEKSRGAEFEKLHDLSKRLDKTMDSIQEMQRLDRQRYGEIVTAVSQHNLTQVAVLIGMYAADKNHMRTMLDALGKLQYQIPINFWISPSPGYQDKGAGPDPLLTVQVHSFLPQQRYYSDTWKIIGNGSFDKDDIVGERDMGYITVTLDFEHNYGIKMQLQERNLLGKENLGGTEMDISGLVQSAADQAAYWPLKTQYGTLTVKIAVKKATFPYGLPKFRD